MDRSQTLYFSSIALLEALRAEGLDFPAMRALADAVAAFEIIPFDDPRHVPTTTGDRVYSPNGIFSWPRSESEYERVPYDRIPPSSKE